jgi:predicted O-methyltransferase YrrM
MFAKIISGKESALGILFPDDPTKISADVFYTESNVSCVVNRMSGDILTNILAKLQTQQDNKEVVRFLEIGGGTGSSTKALLPMIDASKLKYEYTFTDISQMFFTKAKKGFETYEKNMKYKILNIEDDPKAQGFIPHNYDFIIASNVMVCTYKYIVISMQKDYIFYY